MKIIILSLLNISLFAQNNQPSVCYYGKQNKGTSICLNMQGLSFGSNTEAEAATHKIVSAIGLKPNFVMVPCNSIKNCAAVTHDGTRYIVYDKTFLQNIEDKANTDFTSLSILAHEIGHHLNAHTLSYSDNSKRRLDELEADEFSGFIMAKLGANLNEAQAALKTLSHPNCENDIAYDHPCLEKRLKAIENGYKKFTNTTPKDSTNVNNELNPLSKNSNEHEEASESKRPTSLEDLADELNSEPDLKKEFEGLKPQSSNIPTIDFDEIKFDKQTSLDVANEIAKIRSDIAKRRQEILNERAKIPRLATRRRYYYKQ